MYADDLTTIKDVMETVRAKAPCHQSSYSARIRDGEKNVTLSSLTDAIRRAGFTLSSPYHANGIGNNNEFTVTKRIQIDGGYEVDAIIGKLQYTYDIYGKRVYVGFTDKDEHAVCKYPENVTFYENG